MGALPNKKNEEFRAVSQLGRDFFFSLLLWRENIFFPGFLFFLILSSSLCGVASVEELVEREIHDFKEKNRFNIAKGKMCSNLKAFQVFSRFKIPYFEVVPRQVQNLKCFLKIENLAMLLVFSRFRQRKRDLPDGFQIWLILKQQQEAGWCQAVKNRTWASFKTKLVKGIYPSGNLSGIFLE